MIQGSLETYPAEGRRQGFLDEVEPHPQIVVMSERPDCDWKREQAFEHMEAFLASHPPGSLDCVYAHNDRMAIGARTAAQGLGRAKEMIFIGADGLRDEGVKAVLDGELTATFARPGHGKEAIRYALKILAGEKVPKEVPLSTARITRQNAREWYDRLPPSGQ